MRRRVLLVSSSADARAPYEEAAAASGVDLVDDPSAPAVDGVLASDGASAPLAAAAAGRFGLPWHSAAGVATAVDPLLARGRLMALGLPVPWFFTMPADGTLASVADRVRFPCVVKPIIGAGAVPVPDPAAFEAACARLQGRGTLLVEAWVPGAEVVLQGVLTRGALHVLAVVETSHGPRTREDERLAGGMAAHAAAALGLGHGPIHAVCRINASGVFVLALAPWPMETALARSIRFATLGGAPEARYGITLAEILLRHAVGDNLDHYGREA